MRTLADRVIAGEFKPLTNFLGSIGHVTNPLERPSPLAMAVAHQIPRPDIGVGEGICNDIDPSLDLTSGMTTCTARQGEPQRVREWADRSFADVLAAKDFFAAPLDHLTIRTAPQSVYLNRSTL